MKKKFYIFYILFFFFWACAPEAPSYSPNEQTQLPVRPSDKGPILNRSLLNAADSRISYCEILDNDIQTYSGFRDNQLYPLASTSKVIISAWALATLGPHFQFKTELYLNPIDLSTGEYDVFLKTNFDPIMNIEKLLYLISELHQTGVRRIRNLVIDQSTRVFLGVLQNPHLELSEVPIPISESISNLKLIFNSKNWAEKTRQARINLNEWAKIKQKKIILPNEFVTENVILKSVETMPIEKYPIKKVILSSSLLQYLKNMNVYSNNYITDSLFSYLGGFQKFLIFQRDQLQLKQKDLVLLTGSGLPKIENNFRRDNLGSCFAMIKILVFLQKLTQKNQVNLSSLLLNPSQDTDGTFQSSIDLDNSLVLKTGRLFEVPALNAVGYVSTKQGLVSFVFLGHDFLVSEVDEIENFRLQMMIDIFDTYQTSPLFRSTYQPQFFFE